MKAYVYICQLGDGLDIRIRKRFRPKTAREQSSHVLDQKDTLTVTIPPSMGDRKVTVGPEDDTAEAD